MHCEDRRNNPPPGRREDDLCTEAEKAADESAKRAVKLVFAILGVDIDTPAQVQKFQEDLRFNASLRKAAEKSWMGMWGTFGIGIAALIIYLLFKVRMNL
jgi:peroxiredoxin